jgi:hypothetical protein
MGNVWVVRSPEDALLLAMWQGRGSWDGSTPDAKELAIYLEETDQRTVPQSPVEIDRILTNLLDAGLVALAARPLSRARGIEMYRPYVLTNKGLARAHELESLDEHFPPHSDEA